MHFDTERLADYIALNQLASHYGNLIDHREFSRLGEVLADDIVFDMTGISRGVLDGLTEVQRYMEHDAIHPSAHLMSNVTVDVLDVDIGRMTCRLLAVQQDGTVIAGEYQDEVRRNEAGWRFSRRAFTYIRRERTT